MIGWVGRRLIIFQATALVFLSPMPLSWNNASTFLSRTATIVARKNNHCVPLFTASIHAHSAVTSRSCRCASPCECRGRDRWCTAARQVELKVELMVLN